MCTSGSAKLHHDQDEAGKPARPIKFPDAGSQRFPARPARVRHDLHAGQPESLFASAPTTLFAISPDCSVCSLDVSATVERPREHVPGGTTVVARRRVGHIEHACGRDSETRVEGTAHRLSFCARPFGAGTLTEPLAYSLDEAEAEYGDASFEGLGGDTFSPSASTMQGIVGEAAGHPARRPRLAVCKGALRVFPIPRMDSATHTRSR